MGLQIQKNNNMESRLKNMVLCLFIITATCSLAVGAVYMVTKKPILNAQNATTNVTLIKVLPKFDNNPSAKVGTVDIDGGKAQVYTASMGGKVVGYAVQTLSTKGYGGNIEILVGFKPNGEIIRVETLKHNETPGLGDKIESSKSDFALQFVGKNPATMKMSVRKDGGDVDAITASTITSRAFTDAVARAYKVFLSVSGKK